MARVADTFELAAGEPQPLAWPRERPALQGKGRRLVGLLARSCGNHARDLAFRAAANLSPSVAIDADRVLPA